MIYPKHATRYQNIYYGMEAPGRWTFFDHEQDEEMYHPIGERYPTKAELLADLHRFATERGYEIKG